MGDQGETQASPYQKLGMLRTAFEPSYQVRMREEIQAQERLQTARLQPSERTIAKTEATASISMLRRLRT
jgi:hypothetical protein